MAKLKSTEVLVQQKHQHNNYLRVSAKHFCSAPRRPTGQSRCTASVAKQSSRGKHHANLRISSLRQTQVLAKGAFSFCPPIFSSVRAAPNMSIRCRGGQEDSRCDCEPKRNPRSPRQDRCLGFFRSPTYLNHWNTRRQR